MTNKYIKYFILIALSVLFPYLLFISISYFEDREDYIVVKTRGFPVQIIDDVEEVSSIQNRAPVFSVLDTGNHGDIILCETQQGKSKYYSIDSYIQNNLIGFLDTWLNNQYTVTRYYCIQPSDVDKNRLYYLFQYTGDNWSASAILGKQVLEAPKDFLLGKRITDEKKVFKNAYDALYRPSFSCVLPISNLNYIEKKLNSLDDPNVIKVLYNNGSTSKLFEYLQERYGTIKALQFLSNVCNNKCISIYVGSKVFFLVQVLILLGLVLLAFLSISHISRKDYGIILLFSVLNCLSFFLVLNRLVNYWDSITKPALVYSSFALWIAISLIYYHETNKTIGTGIQKNGTIQKNESQQKKASNKIHSSSKPVLRKMHLSARIINTLRWILFIPASGLVCALVMAIISILFRENREIVAYASQVCIPVIALSVTYKIVPKKKLGLLITGGFALLVNTMKVITIYSSPFYDDGGSVVIQLFIAIFALFITGFYFWNKDSSNKENKEIKDNHNVQPNNTVSDE